MMRVLNFLVIAALVAAAAHVYRIKFESTRQMERIAELRTEIRREQDTIATLRAEWSKLDTPARIQELAIRHLQLKPVDPRQFDTLRNLPARPSVLTVPMTDDPIAALLESSDALEIPTSSIPAPRVRR